MPMSKFVEVMRVDRSEGVPEAQIAAWAELGQRNCHLGGATRTGAMFLHKHRPIGHLFAEAPPKSSSFPSERLLIGR